MRQLHAVASARRAGNSRARGFTLVEMMITLVVLTAVMIALGAIMFAASRSKIMTVNQTESSQAARTALDMIGQDLRTAGYGTDLDYTSNPQPAIAYVDSMELLMCVNLKPYPDTAAVKGSPLAYNPAGIGKPFTLDGTAWQPPIRYNTGAEIVRWTMDANNDGVVNASDLTVADGTDAARTPNPNDFMLLRQVYGDSTGLASGQNGPTTDRVALISKPGGTAPPIFTVYMKGSSTPWSWALGPVPPSQLKNIASVLVQVTAPSGRPDSRGRYAQSIFRTNINSLRNTPNFGDPTFAVFGYVYNDINRNMTQDGEPGIANAFVTLGDYSTYTNASGYFQFQAPAGTRTLRHYPPQGFGVRQSPDSFVVTVGPAATFSFADTATAGGWITATVWHDLDENQVQDGGEWRLRSVKVTRNPGSVSAYSDSNGIAMVFAPVGPWTLTCTPPDSFSASTPNPASGTMTNGGSASVPCGLYYAPTGTIKGTVFADNNKNGIQDSESGVAGVYVAVVRNDDQNVLAFGYTNSSGEYSLDVPFNDPDHTRSYSVTIIPPNGYFPTTPSAIGNLWVVGGSTLSGNNFGISAFQIISVSANRVLSLASRDLFENDWGASVNNAQKDVDIILGADAAGTDQISVWFNRYNSSPLFDTTPTYTRIAGASVLSMAVDTLDIAAPKSRADLVTGTTWTTNGNFFVWLNQNSTSNEGYIPTSPNRSYKTSDKGDVTAVLLADIAGGNAADMPDIIVGTKSPTANKGTIEVWKSDNKATPAYGQDDVYPNDGGVAGNSVGEVTSMVLADLDKDGRRDLIVGTRTGSFSGQIILLQGTTEDKSNKPHFVYQTTIVVPTEAVTAVGAVDVDGDGNIDIIAGTQASTSTGSIRYYKNTVPAAFTFVPAKTVDAGGVVHAVAIADLGGSSRGDLAVGLRSSTTGYAGGLRIYYLDGGNLPDSGTDPSGGTVTNFVPALSTGNYNYGTNPLPASPFLTDLSAGVKSSATAGQLVVFIR